MKKNQMRTSVVPVILLGALSLGLLSAPASNAAALPAAVTVQTAVAPNPVSDTYNAQVLAIINQKRVAAGSKPVVWNQKIGNVSQDWAIHLGEATKSATFDWDKIHRSDAGGSLIPAGATWYRENIAFNGSAQSIVDWWMGSAGHKAAMLDPKATDIGIGYVVPTSGPYTGWHMVVSNLAAYPSSGGAATAPISVTAGTQYKTTIQLNLRSGAGTTFSILGAGVAGTTVTATGKTNDIWVEVKMGSLTGWMSSEYLTEVVTAPAPTPAPTPVPTSTKVLNTIDTSGKLWAYKAPGNSTLGSRTELGTGWGAAKQILSTDWNQDGTLDIVAKWNNGYVTFYQGIGNDDYKNPVNIGSGWQAYDLTATKLRTTDKYPGLVARNTVDGKLYYYSNPSGGAIGSRILIGNGGWVPMTEINALDWDNNGKMDLLVRNSAGQLVLYRTNGAGTILNETRPVVGAGWGGFQSINSVPDFASPGSVGLFAQSSNGTLRYYPIVNGKFGTMKVVGTSGWSGYNSAAGSIGK